MHETEQPHRIHRDALTYEKSHKKGDQSYQNQDGPSHIIWLLNKIFMPTKPR